MKWNFTKMHGTGNDFIILDGTRQLVQLTPERVRALANRSFGIGADQVLLVEKASSYNADFRYRIFNADGKEVEHCGNGARCFVRFVHQQKLSSRNPLRAEINGNNIIVLKEDNDVVTVNMGPVSFDPDSVQFDCTGLSYSRQGQGILWNISLKDIFDDLPINVSFSIISISNPHIVLIVKDIKVAPVKKIGSILESHQRFANRTNVGFMQIMSRNSIKLRVYERSVGETLSCGTGACAAAMIGFQRGLLDFPVIVSTSGGDLSINYNDKNLQLSGPADFVFTGKIDIKKLVRNYLK